MGRMSNLVTFLEYYQKPTYMKHTEKRYKLGENLLIYNFIS